MVQTSVQSLKVNYFGRYIAQQIDTIPPEEIAEAQAGKFPAVLVISPGQYLRQVRSYLEGKGYQCEAAAQGEAVEVRRDEGLAILHEQPDANLGWRILIERDNPPFSADVILTSVTDRTQLIETVPADYRRRILAEAGTYVAPPQAVPTDPVIDPDRPTIKFASFEGSKGLSAQHVFVVGMHEGDLPQRPVAIDDLEICKMIVAITRTRKQCHLMYTKRWGKNARRPSPFLGWIRPERRRFVNVTKAYW